MKQLIFSVITILSFSAHSQSSILLSNNTTSAVLAPNSIVSVATTANTNVKFTFDIKNNSSTQKSYIAKRYDIVLHSSNSTIASAYFCFAGSCYGDQTFVSPTPLTLDGGQSASQLQGQYNVLVADLDEAATVGYSLVKYTFVNAGDASDSVQVSLSYNSPLAINDLTKNLLSSVELFPNPANEAAVLKLTSARSAKGKVTIFNALGRVVSEKDLFVLEGKNEIDINLLAISSGFYTVQVSIANSQMTKRLIVK